jgi:hypothetical protein
MIAQGANRRAVSDMLPGCRSLAEVEAYVREEYRREHPRLWRCVTVEQAVKSAKDAFLSAYPSGRLT